MALVNLSTHHLDTMIDSGVVLERLAELCLDVTCGDGALEHFYIEQHAQTAARSQAAKLGAYAEQRQPAALRPADLGVPQKLRPTKRKQLAGQRLQGFV